MDNQQSGEDKVQLQQSFEENNRSSLLKTISIGLGVIGIGLAIGIGGYFLGVKNNKTFVQDVRDEIAASSPTPTVIEQSNLTPDQIFSEVSSRHNIDKNKLSYFRIFGQDKVQYDGVFAYKQNGAWYIAQNGAQSVVDCSELNSVPEQYRPPCFDQKTEQLKYVDDQRQSINYPLSGMISYIGE